MHPCRLVLAVLIVPAIALLSVGQEYGQPDRDAPGDRMIQAYLSREAKSLEGNWLAEAKSVEDWEKQLPRYREEYLYMLGLWPLPSKTPLKPTITGSLVRDGYCVDRIHYQSMPRLYVTGNLYRPAKTDPGQRLPAVLYVCGHSNMGRDGNKTAYQAHGIWLAKHGYVCLAVDTLQLGEIASIHHGTYRENRWWWYARGYTPAGVECWNGMRGIDYLVSRPDVDPERIAVTGISGGGAATFWIAAADPRVRVAVPVSGMADLESYVANRVINGHCDCMFLYNTFRWPWTRIAALIAPRALLFANSDADAIFPMDANQRVINRLERVYSLFGASDRVDAMVSIGGHAYRQDLRQAAFRFLNLNLKNDARPVADSELDLVVDEKPQRFPIQPADLRVFASESDLPKDALNRAIDEHFVPRASVNAPRPGEFDAWKQKLLAELRRVTFGFLPPRIPAATLVVRETPNDTRLESEPGIEVSLSGVPGGAAQGVAARILLVVLGPQSEPRDRAWVERQCTPSDAVYLLAPRGVGRTSWTQKNPPNYVERAHALLGCTADTGRIRDVAAAARYLHAAHQGKAPVFVVGDGTSGILAAYAALLEPEIAGVMVRRVPLGHAEPDAPHLLNVLRVCDIPDALGMLAPRPLRIEGVVPEKLAKVNEIYAAAGQSAHFRVEP